jgi:hypothetical protein
MQREAIDWVSRGPRRSARLTGSAQWADGREATVLVTNLSYLGCRIFTDRDLVKGETVRLTLPGLGEMHAQVRWIRDGSAGVKFLTGDSARDLRRARLGI